MRPDTPEQIGRRIKAIRKCGLFPQIRTQEKLAALLGVSGKSAVSNWERGRNEPDRMYLLPLLEPPFNLNLDYILMGLSKHLPWETAEALREAESRMASSSSRDTSNR